MTSAVLTWAKTLEVVNQTVTTIDFEPQEVNVSRFVKATVQPAQKERLNKDLIDWALKYVQVHSKEPMEIGEFFRHEGVTYKVVDSGDFQRYGFTDCVGEEVKNCEITFTWQPEQENGEC